MYKLNISDMTCSHCASTVEKAAKAVDPKANVTVDLQTKTASIDSDIGSAAFAAAIEDAGYKVSFGNSCCGQGA
ncbi:heavy-metal-associated domain-containing protein [Sinorhizobium arboris]|uniref:heavy-metal-associated domain-containing protein n=1 Tax=Sinorhizobium arboris TaxID=76745 RepID=UPI0003F54403|nr:heavy-metal-associated domain-containing protein [Sinorhizobium arboris]